MKHRLMSGLLAAMMAATTAFGFAACGGGGGNDNPPSPSPHTHTFASTWTADEEFHWHEATCTDTDEQKDRAAHDYKNGVCGTCKYAHKNHTYEGITCSVCGYTLSDSKLQYEEVLGEDGETVTGYSVIGWDESETDRANLIVPAEHNGKPVVAIGEMAFYLKDGDETLAFVHLPESVKDLGSYAFYGCSALESIDLGHVENVERAAFYNCTGLESAEMGALKNLGQSAFYGSGVRKLSFGKAFSTEADVFKSNTFPDVLESIEVSGENTTYATENGILYNKDKTEIVCVPKSIKGRVTIADGVTEIKNSESHFKNHNRLTSLTIPASVASIEHDFIRKSLAGCDTLAEIYNLSQVTIDKLSDFGLGESTVIHASLSEKSVVTDPDEDGFVWRTDADVLHTYLGQEKQLTLPDGHNGKPYAVAARAFYGSDLTKVTVSPKVTSLGEDCFHTSAALTEVVMQEGIEELGVGAFYNCTALKKISIPKSVTKIGAGAFAMITGEGALERVDYAGTVSEWAAIYFGNAFSNIFVNDAKEKQATLYLGDGNPLPAKITIEGIEKVSQNAFYGAPVEEVVLGKGVKEVGQDAFAYCANLKSVVIGKDMENFYHAFPNGSPIETLYYEGTQETWATLNNGNGGSSALRSAEVSYFSAQSPSAEQWGQSDRWWHYGADGSVTPWTK